MNLSDDGRPLDVQALRALCTPDGPDPSVRMAHLFITQEQVDLITDQVTIMPVYGGIESVWGVPLYRWTVADVRYYRTRSEESVRDLLAFVRTVRPGVRTVDVWEQLLPLAVRTPEGGRRLTDCEALLSMFAALYSDRPGYRFEWGVW